MTAQPCGYVVFQASGVVGRCSESVHLTGEGIPLCPLHSHATPPPSRVYLLLWGEYVKIGYSVEPSKRVRSLMRDGTNLPADATGIPVLLTTALGDLQTERLLHAAFAEHRVNGEWFRREGPVERMVQAVTTDGTAAAVVAEAGAFEDPALTAEVDF